MFEKLLLGHLLGDYLLQNQWMALNKSKNSWIGWLAAFVHCIIYTFSICMFMQNFDMIWIIVVFLSHFPIDKFGLAEKYMHYIKGSGMKDYLLKDKQNVVLNRYDMLEGGFASLVYTITDNSLHLIIMYLVYQIIY